MKSGRPILEGTKISILQITNLVYKYNMDPEQIVQTFGDIDTVETVDAALAYYEEHPHEMQKLQEEDIRSKERLKERAINY